MKRSIEGKVYNTETATEICDISRGHSGDFEHVNAELYVTKKGAFFIAGWGGASTRFAKSTSDGNGRVGSDGIIPLSEREALEYCEEHAWDKVEEFFEVEEA